MLHQTVTYTRDYEGLRRLRRRAPYVFFIHFCFHSSLAFLSKSSYNAYLAMGAECLVIMSRILFRRASALTSQ